jgi:hypothetical protein
VTTAEREIRIKTPEPHAKQKAFITSPAKRKVIVAGRRGGKTTAAALDAVDDFLDGRRVLEAAPTQDQTEQFWEKCKDYLSPLIELGLVYKNETRRMLKWTTGRRGRIRCKTAWDADTLRGDFADKLILDEYSLMSPTAWSKVGAPMLLDNDGDATFIFTPQRRNHGYALYIKARADESGRYAAWHFTSMGNPHLSKAALAEITEDMTEDDYNQEILAEFLENEGAVFHRIGRCLYTPEPGHGPAGHEGHTLVMGVDWGKKQDYTVGSIGCIECGREVALVRFNKIGYDIQRGRLASAAAEWGVEYILVELNAVGEGNFDQMVADELPVAGWTMTAVSKPPLISNLALAIEEAQILLLDDPIATAELESFEVKYSPNTNRPTYSAPEGCHDDIVIARALMARCVIDRESALL